MEKQMPSQELPGVSVIVPTLNEELNIDALLRRIFLIDTPSSPDFEVVVVDSNSEDETGKRVNIWSDTFPVRLVSLQRNEGLASAVLAGARESRYEHVVVMDADLSHPPEKIPELIQPLIDGSADVVIGSRYIPGGSTPDWPCRRRVISRLAGLPALLFTEANDPMAGFFATTRNRLNSLREDIPGFKIGLELLATGADDLRVLEIPIVFRDRLKGRSKMNGQVVIDYLRQTAQLTGVDTALYTLPRIVMLGILGVLINFLVFIVFNRSGLGFPVIHAPGILASGLATALFMSYCRRGREYPKHGAFGMSFIIVLALFSAIGLEGGFSLFFQKFLFLNETISMLPASIIGVHWFLLIYIVFAFSSYPSLSRRIKLRLTAACCIVYAVLLRLSYFGVLSLIEQEAYYWNQSNHLTGCFLDTPPVTALLIWAGCSVLGVTEIGVRIFALVCWFCTACFTYLLTRRIYGNTAALGAILLVSTLPFYFGIAMIMTPDAPLLVCWSALLYVLYLRLVDGQGTWLLAGLILGIGVLSSFWIILLIPAVFIFMLTDSGARKQLATPGPYAALLIASVLFLPVLVWNYFHEWATVTQFIDQWFDGRSSFSVHQLAGYILLILMPPGIVAAVVYLFAGKDGRSLHLGMGGWETRGNDRRSGSYLATMAAIPLLIAFGFSFFEEAKLNWTAPFWLAILPALGCSIMTVKKCLRPGMVSRLLNRLWLPTIIFLLVLYTSFLHHAGYGIPGVAYPAKPFLTGWETFCMELEQVVSRSEQQTGARPVVVGMNPYQLSSGLAFYRTRAAIVNGSDDWRLIVDETVGWHVFGWDSLMYHYWKQPEEIAGRDILAIASSKVRTEYPYFQKHIRKMDQVQDVPIKRGAEVIKTLYVRHVYDYNPDPGR